MVLLISTITLCSFASSAWYRCKSCDGKGYSWTRTCSSCSGKGQKMNIVDCQRCGGNGYTRDTYGEKIKCTRCDDSKKEIKYTTCASCNGRGEVNMPCRTCNGKGEVWVNE